MIKLTRSVVILVVLVGLGFAQTGIWRPFDNAPEAAQQLRVLSSDNSRTILELELPGIYVESRTIDGREYRLIGIPVEHGGLPDKIGSPQLPLVSRMLAVPPNGDVKLNVIAVEEQTLTGYNVYPLQPPQPEGGEAPEFTRDDARYSADALYPAAWARIEEPAIWRDYRIVPLVVQPVRCNPKTGELKVARRIRVELVHAGPARSSRPRISRTFAPLYREYIANYDFLPPTTPITGTYLIITSDSFASDVQPLADWKHRKGWRVKTVRLSELGGNDSTHIYNYIHDAYLNWPYPVDYVLLVGDVEFLYRCIGDDGVGTDHAYTKHEGTDYLSELLLARISVKNHTECQTVVNKLVRYETDPDLSNPEWFRKASTVGGYESGWPDRFWTCCVQARNELLAHSPITQVDTFFQRWNLATPTNIANAVNEGRSWVLYRGHGAETYWDNVVPDWTNALVATLDNGRMNPMVIGPTCLSGKYDYTGGDCHAEAWLKAGTPTEPKGAIGYFGSSEVSYTGHNDSLSLGTFVGYCESLNFSMAQSTYNGKLYMYRAYPPPNGTTQVEFDMFNNFGEPELQIFTNTPAPLTVNHPATVRIGTSQFPVQVTTTGPVANALVCVMSGRDTAIWANGYTDAAGEVLFTLNCTEPGDSIYVTVTGRNLMPCLGAAIVVASNTPYMTHLRHAVDDAAGNGDGIINPAEAIRLPVWFKNWGSADANAVSATLRTTDPQIGITDSLRALGLVPAGDSAYTGLPGFGFTVSSSCTNGYTLRLSLVCRDAQDSTWTSNLALRCGTALLGYAGQHIDDAPPGNGNGRVDPGETAGVYVSLRNTGLGHGDNVRAVLRSGDVRLQVVDSLADFGRILKDSIREAGDAFAIHVDEGIMPNSSIPCTLCATADGGYARVIPFTIVVGETRSIDPIPDNAQPPIYWAYDNVDSNYNECPAFEWIEVRGRGTRLTLSDDQTVTITLPPAFGPLRFYGQRYTQLAICGNGFIVPGSYSSAPYTNAALPTSSISGPAICANWDDLYPPTGGGVWWFLDTANHALVVEFDSVSYYPSGSGYDKFEFVILDSTLAAADGSNRITVQYLTANGYAGNTAGIQNQNYTIGINCLFNGAYTRGVAPIAAGRAIRYTGEYPVNSVVEPAGGLPRALTGLRVFPNPATEQVRINWSLAVPGRARVTLHDASGRIVRMLVNAELAAGSYGLQWRGDDNLGRRVPAGIYFCKLAVPDWIATEKLVLTR